jgi:hypothetical protein
VSNFTADSDIHVKYNETEYPDGKVGMICNNITIFQVYKFSHPTQILEIEEFESNLNDCLVNIEELGDNSFQQTVFINVLLDKLKDPAFAIFNVSFKALINVALIAARAALLATLAG